LGYLYRACSLYEITVISGLEAHPFSTCTITLVLRTANGSSIESTELIGLKALKPPMDFCCRALGFLAIYRRQKSITPYDSTASLPYINQDAAAGDNVGSVDKDLHNKG
jgi:hypothetical protein